MKNKSIIKKIKTLLPGESYFARVHEPFEEGMDAGKYSIKLKVSDKAKKTLAKLADDLAKEVGFKGEYKKVFMKKLDDEDVVQAKTNRAPRVEDSDGKPIKDLIGNGSEVRLSISLGTYEIGSNRGVTMYFDRLVVDKLKEYGGKSAGIAADFGGSDDDEVLEF